MRKNLLLKWIVAGFLGWAAHGSAWAEGGQAAALYPEPGRTARLAVNRRVVALTIPESLMARPPDDAFGEPFIAEVSLSTDGGRTWEGHGLHKDIGRPLVVALPGDGQFGLAVTLYDRMARRLGVPQPGDAPPLTLTIDTVPPKIVFDVPHGQNFWRGGQRIEIPYRVTDDNLPERPVKIELTLDAGESWRPVLEDGAPEGVLTWQIPDGVSAGSCFLRLVAVDRAGNVATARNPDPIVIDSTPPTVRLLGPRVSNSTSVPLYYDADDGAGSGVASIELYVSHDGGHTWALARREPHTGRPFAYAASEGITGLFMAASDRAGNRSAAPAEGTPPQLTLLVGEGQPLIRMNAEDIASRYRAGDSVTIAWQGAADYLPDRPVTVQFSGDGGIHWQTLAADAPAEGQLRWTVPNAASPASLLRVALRDQSGRIAFHQTPEPFVIEGGEPVTGITLPGNTEPPTAPEAIVLKPQPPAPAAPKPQRNIEPVSWEALARDGGGGQPNPLADPYLDDGGLARLTADIIEGPPAFEPPRTVDAMLRHALAYSREGKHILALQYLNQALERDGRRAETHYELGKVHASRDAGFDRSSQIEAWQAALLCFEKAIELDPQMDAAYNDLGLVLLKMDRPNEALARFDAAQRMKPGSAVYAYNAGLALYRLERLAEALERFEASYRANPQQQECLWYLARISQELGETERAIRFWRQAALAYGPDSPYGRRALQNVHRLETGAQQESR